MRRGANGPDALETINAAATAIASAETRGDHASSAQKRRWGSFWSLYWCFGSPKTKRIGHAILVPETSSSGADSTTAVHSSQPPSIVLPFVAPPSSPASFLPSETPSSTQSPTGILSMASASANMNSPGPASMFAIGPYAHETQLVSPPVFSTFTTEPSTAPYTPPPESVHMTTPSSPEVPFARLLEPNLQNGQRYPFSQYEFQSYQLQPGSPVSHLISPSSGISGSGTSSPFPEHPFFLELQTGNYPPKLLELDKIVLREWESRQGSGTATPDPRSRDNFLLNRQDSDMAPVSESAVSHRVSFEITNEEVVRCVEKKEPNTGIERSLIEKTSVGESSNRKQEKEKDEGDGETERRHQKNRTITLGSSKEFNFENVDEDSDWFVGEEGAGHSEKWSFFPMMQSGVS